MIDFSIYNYMHHEGKRMNKGTKHTIVILAAVLLSVAMRFPLRGADDNQQNNTEDKII